MSGSPLNLFRGVLAEVLGKQINRNRGNTYRFSDSILLRGTDCNGIVRRVEDVPPLRGSREGRLSGNRDVSAGGPAGADREDLLDIHSAAVNDGGRREECEKTAHRVRRERAELLDLK